MKKASTIGWKLLFAFGVVAGLSATSAFVGWLSFNDAQKTQNEITSNTVPTLNKVRSIAQSSRLLVATTPNLVEARTHDKRKIEAEKLVALTKGLHDQLSPLSQHVSSDELIQSLRFSTHKLIKNVETLNTLVEKRITIQSQFQKNTARVLSDIDSFVDLSEALVSNASATTSTRIADLSRMLEQPQSKIELQNTLDELIDIDIDHMELMFEMRHRVAILGLLVEQNSKAETIKGIERLQNSYQKNIQIVKRRSQQIRDPNRQTSLDGYLKSLAPHSDKTHIENLFDLRQEMLIFDTSINAVLKTNNKLTTILQGNVDEMLNIAESQMSEALQTSEKKMQTSYILMLLIAIFSIVGAIPVMWFYVRNRVVNRINTLSENTHAIVEGELDVHINTSGDDELTEMAQALEVFRTNAIEKLKIDEELREHKNHLENIVEERTNELTQTNAQLKDEAEKHAYARDEAERANNVKSAFLASMSHEIRTPITSILGTLHLFDHTDVRPKTKQRLDVIRASGETLLSIINDILDYSKIEANSIEITQEEFDLHDLVNDLQLMVSPIAERKDLSLLFVPNIASPAFFKGDPGHIRQVLINILGNAIKFTQQGKVIFTYNQVEEGVVFEIEDTGPGIPETEQNHLFSEFYQSTHTKNLSSSGTGLGLTICKRLIDEMKGSIEVHSELNQGSLFKIFIPLEGVHKVQLDEAIENTTISQMQDLNILLVEDNLVNQDITVSFLENANYLVEVVTCGEDAVTAVSEKQYDLILMDVSLPGIDGLEAVRQIRQIEEKHIPVIAISAHVFQEEIDSYIECGMDGFLAKPFSPAQLYKAISAILAGNDIHMDHRKIETSLIFDENVLNDDLPVLGQERILKLIHLFIAKIETDLDEVTRCFKDGDNQTLSSLAHSMKSAAGSLGLSLLFETAKNLEMAAKKANKDECHDILDKLSGAISQSVEALQAYENSLDKN